MTFRQRLWEFITSVKLTLFLLAGIGLLLVLGTWVETKYGSEAALAVIYRSPLMDAMIFLLGVNQVTCTIRRYPYKPHQLGWLITHVGVLIILVGSIYGRRGQLEGTIQLAEGQATSSFLMEVVEEGEQRYYEVPLGFTLALRDFEVRNYPGTGMASDYRSSIVASDPDENRRFQQVIRVNHPLNYNGFVIAQQSYREGPGGVDTSVFSVLRNPGTPVIFFGFVVLSVGIAVIVFFKSWLMQRFTPALHRERREKRRRRAERKDTPAITGGEA